MQLRSVATVLSSAAGIGRALTGVVFLAAPGRAADSWVGSSSTESRYLVRAVGGRDLVIGAGVLRGLASGRSSPAWLAASIGSDLVDASMGALMLDGAERKKSLAFGLGFAALGVAAIGTAMMAED